MVFSFPERIVGRELLGPPPLPVEMLDRGEGFVADAGKCGLRVHTENLAVLFSEWLWQQLSNVGVGETRGHVLPDQEDGFDHLILVLGKELVSSLKGMRGFAGTQNDLFFR